ncbi:MAG: DUF4956 domain-containing protein [Ruminococcaceae bacterium]|nr:DUF4956 domain-containing protein [Oscillospiraceae bacterium]MBQ8325118.1 DUF4956 domain-containing protein [Clostridia bacterium]
MPFTFESILETNTMLNAYLIALAVSLVCGALTAFAAGFRSYATKSFLMCLILLPMIVTTVIMMVNGNVGTGVAVMGAFSLVRFRSVPGKAKDIAAIFLTMTAGLACAAGYVAIAVLFTVLVCAVMVVLSFIPMGVQKIMDLTVTVPETLHFHDAFADVFAKYTSSCRLVRTKTTNMGSLYKLFYKVRLKDRNQMQAFIDDLRVRNGNLEISLAEAADNGEDL